MNRFELFCMIFFVLDAEWDESGTVELGTFLSGANPFLFADIGSADPEIYANFCERVPDVQIRVEDSYGKASAYIASLNDDTVSKAFHTIDEQEWMECVKDYLSQEHKGGDTVG